MKHKEKVLYFFIMFFMCLSVYENGRSSKYQYAYELAREFNDFVIKNNFKHNVGLICNVPKVDKWPGRP